ncbi:hypothetical protein [Huintestinicola sp.]|uniref:hypothetical protein n=1 Tax=Huintestinicola sp. TaxID=2981661 RepID=UPI003D7C962A
MKKYEILANYVYNRREYLEQDIKQLQENLRYRTISQIDCLELIIAEERLKMFIEVTSDIRHILGLDNPANIESEENFSNITRKKESNFT